LRFAAAPSITWAETRVSGSLAIREMVDFSYVVAAQQLAPSQAIRAVARDGMNPSSGIMLENRLSTWLTCKDLRAGGDRDDDAFGR